MLPLSHQTNQGQRVHGHAGRGTEIRESTIDPHKYTGKNMKVGAPDILNASILIVDDQESNVSLLERLLGEAGYTRVASTLNPQEVCALHRKNGYDILNASILIVDDQESNVSLLERL